MRADSARLNSGATIPLLGFGTYSYPNDRLTTRQAVLSGIEMGYRHFDTAKIYGSEAAVGDALTEAISKGILEREDVFVTSKLWSSDHNDPPSALAETLKRMGIEYIDMYLVHWPVKLKPWVCYPLPKEEDFEREVGLEETWRGMERCVEMGLCKGVGLSNFSSNKLLHLLDSAALPPAINQVEMHPMWRQKRLRKVCTENQIHVSAYSPLGGPGNEWGSTAVVDHPAIASIALKHKATPAQVALRWGLSKGSSVIVKSFNEERMKENMAALNVKLDEEDITAIDELEERKIMRGEFLVNQTTSPYMSIHDLWDGEI